MTIAEIIGIAGFILAFITLLLTRYEKRKTLVISLYDGEIEQIGDNRLEKTYGQKICVIVEIINNCEKTIVIDKNIIRLVINNKEIGREIEWINIDETEAFLTSGMHVKYGVSLDELFKELGIKPNTEKLFKIEAYVRDVSGKKYKSKNNYYIDNISKSIRIK